MAPDKLGELGDRKECELVEVGRFGAGCDFAPPHRTAGLGLNFSAGRQWIEHDRGTYRIVDRDLVQRLDALFLLFQAIEHQLALSGLEAQSGDFLGAGDGFDGDVGAGNQLRPEYSGEKCRRQAGTGEVAHEGATIERD